MSKTSNINPHWSTYLPSSSNFVDEVSHEVQAPSLADNSNLAALIRRSSMQPKNPRVFSCQRCLWRRRIKKKGPTGWAAGLWLKPPLSWVEKVKSLLQWPLSPSRRLTPVCLCQNQYTNTLTPGISRTLILRGDKIRDNNLWFMNNYKLQQ